MKKWLKRLLKKEEGQALAEYSVLFPGVLMLAIAMGFTVAPTIQTKYCEVVNVFSNGLCEVAEAGGEPDGEEPPAGPTETSTPGPTTTPTPTEEYCVVLQESQGCSQCDAHPECVCLPGVNEGTYEADDLKSLVIKAGKEYHVFYSGWTDDGCYYVQLEDTYAWWQKYETGSDCKDVSHVQAWWVLLCQD